MGQLVFRCGDRRRGGVGSAWHSGVTLRSSSNVHEGFGLDVTEQGGGQQIHTKGRRATKGLFFFSSCVESICSVMWAAVGLGTHCRAAHKRPGLILHSQRSPRLCLSPLLGTELSSGSP